LFIASPEASGVGKPAKTLYWVKTRFKNYTLLEVEILTGRTHQIRVHLKALGHPVVGDELYKSRRLKEKAKINRIFLHAASLSFVDLRGRRQKYQSDLPEELKEFLKKIK
jgi:23S rRNA-/tRNA-specific pseudouridylate synthase